MIEIPVQMKVINGVPAFFAFGDDSVERALSYRPNQICRAKITGHKRPRSVQQNRWIHAIFRIVASNSPDPDWDTPDKVKRNVKMAMKFFKDEVIVSGNKVYFELRSFAFDEMDQREADVKYDEAKLVCARHLGVDPAVLESEAIWECEVR